MLKVNDRPLVGQDVEDARLVLMETVAEAASELQDGEPRAGLDRLLAAADALHRIGTITDADDSRWAVEDEEVRQTLIAHAERVVFLLDGGYERDFPKVYADQQRRYEPVIQAARRLRERLA